MMKRRFLWILLWTMCLLSAYANRAEVRTQTLKTTDGLPSNIVRAILQDSQGFLWFGTMNGLSRYDGHTFRNFYAAAPGNGQPGLIDNRINGLTEDHDGFLWISTAQRHYSCYDLQRDRFVDISGGRTMEPEYSRIHLMKNGDVWLWHPARGLKRVTHSANRTLTTTLYNRAEGNLPDDNIRFVHEDTLGRTLWIGTAHGLAAVRQDRAVNVDTLNDFLAAGIYKQENYFLTAKGHLLKYAPEDGLQQVADFQELFKNNQLTGHFILSGQWVFLTAKGCYGYHFSDKKILPDERFPQQGGIVQFDNHGHPWIYNHTGRIYHIHPHTGRAKALDLLPAERLTYIDRERYRIVRDGQGLIWIATYGNGLFAYDETNEQLQHFTTGTDKDSPLSSDYLLYLKADRAGGIWVSMEHAGLLRLNLLSENVKRILPEGSDNFDRGNMVRMVQGSENGSIRMGTNNGQVYDYNPANDTFLPRKAYPANVYTTVADSTGRVWIGTRGEGLKMGDTWYKNRPSDTASLSHNTVFSLCRDRKGRIWIGTLGGGLNLAQRTAEGEYTFRRFVWPSFGKNQVRVIQEDTAGRLWLGTSSGLYVFHPDSLISGQEGKWFSHDNGGFCSNEIRCLYADEEGKMWAGTSGAGAVLCQLSPDGKQLNYESFSTQDGLVHDNVQSILKDEQGKLWIATEYGMSRLDPQTRSSKNYFFSTYTLGDSYSENTAYRDEEGRLYFGTDYGLTLIDPALLPADTLGAPIVFTNLYVNGNRVTPATEDSPLEVALAYADRIVLKHYQNSIQLDFSVFDYDHSGQAKYQYRLEGYEKDWNVPSETSSVSYKYLPPGSYTLQVKSLAPLKHEQEATLDIVITPPWWKSRMAVFCYLLLLVLAGWVAYRIMANFNRMRNRIEVERQLTEYKLVFFTNVSHEFRTPLTLIQGALEHMVSLKNIPVEMQSPLRTLERSTQRMLRLVNQLLTFRKAQKGKLSVALQEADVIAFLYDIYLSFGDVAEQKRMDYQFHASLPSYIMYIDKDHLDKIAYNLLSNAFKYTPAGGTVACTVTVEEAGKQLRFQVSDNGIGVPPEKRPELFKRFMSNHITGDSIGVGLHLTHELVTLLQGTIVYEERPGGGSLFTVNLPIRIPTPEEQAKEAGKELPDLKEDRNGAVRSAQQVSNEVVVSSSHKILIIEDDADVRRFLQEEIGRYFQVETAEDGLSGQAKATTYEPDLIVCDVMMPGRDGFEVTRQLKQDFATSHIPVILLTALSSIEQQTQGIEAGADAYISKPFSLKFLLARITRLIEGREKLRAKYASQPGIAPATVYTTASDRGFAERMSLVLEANLSRSDFSMDDFAAQMKMSRTAFYKKLKGLTGYSPVEYLRLMRMKKGAELLLTSEENLNVAEVAYRVGLNDPFYFSKCFKAQFGVSPSAYQKNGGRGQETEP